MLRILLTGANGYIGKRLLPILLQKGYYVYGCVRDPIRAPKVESRYKKQYSTITLDFLNPDLFQCPKDIDAAFFLMHAMSTSHNKFDTLEQRIAHNFCKFVSDTDIKHVIYLSGIVNTNKLSKHLQSRKNVEEILEQSKQFSLTTLKAGIIIGSGSASFEIIRDLVEKLPIMITPKWLNTKCQPISIHDVLTYLSSTLLNTEVYNKSYDIGGTNILTYKEMLLEYAKLRGLKRKIYTLPVMTAKLSSYWLYFITSTSYKLAISLVDSMHINVVCQSNELQKILNEKPLSYQEALKRTLDKVQTNHIISSWKDSIVNGIFSGNVSDYINVPHFGCFIDCRKEKYQNKQKTVSKIWAIGGDTGWYYANKLWQLRGLLDKIFGGVGLRRGRTNPYEIHAGEALDFWRVLYANKQEGRLLLYAEMKLPGEAWLEFKIEDQYIIQTATYRPKGLWGRVYWFLVLPFHNIIFKNLCKQIAL